VSLLSLIEKHSDTLTRALSVRKHTNVRNAYDDSDTIGMVGIHGIHIFITREHL